MRSSTRVASPGQVNVTRSQFRRRVSVTFSMLVARLRWTVVPIVTSPSPWKVTGVK